MVIIAGLGQTGQSFARYCQRMQREFCFFADVAAPSGLTACQDQFPQAEIYLQQLPETVLAAADTLLLSPGIPISHQPIQRAQQQGLEILGDIECFARLNQTPVIAITGTNGKSTVTHLLGTMAQRAGKRAQVGGNIGVPVLDLLTSPTADLIILEISSFQLQVTQSLAPLAATILNITPDHLDHHTDMKEYVEAKHQIYHQAQYAVFNRDDRLTTPVDGSMTTRSFGLNLPDAEQFGFDQGYLYYGKEKLIAAAEMKLTGRHNIANALAALALGTVAGLTRSSMLETLRLYSGLPHRCQLIAEFNGVRWYNDSKATNVDATCAALNAFSDYKGRLIWIAGGLGKQQDFKPLAASVQDHVKQTIVFGQDAAAIAKVTQAHTATQIVESLQQAITCANHCASSGDIVLFSPACASFDMFRNYKQRGEQFMTYVQQLKQGMADD